MNLTSGEIGLLFAILLQAITLTAWLTRLGGRVEVLESKSNKEDKETKEYRQSIFSKIDNISERLIKVETSTEYTKVKIDDIERKLEKKQ